jgi:hypothetical protein
VVGTSALPLVHATARGGTLELIVKDGKMPNNRNPKKAVPNLDIDRLMEAMSGMPCDNCDDPELVAENERLANESWEEIGYKPGAGKE